MTDDRFDEMLTLSTRPPDDLLERIQARRAAGERVLLPTVPPARPAATTADVTAPAAAPVVAPITRPTRRSWRWAAAPAGVAAAALVAVLTQRTRGGPAIGGPAIGGPPSAPSVAASGGAAPAVRVRPADAGVQSPADRDAARLPVAPSVTPSVAPAKPVAAPAPPRTRVSERLRSAPLAVPAPRAHDAAPQPATTPDGDAGAAGGSASAALRVLGGAYTLGVADMPGAPSAEQRPMLDSLARVLAREPARRAVVRYVDPAFTRESASWRLASRVADYLVSRGVEPERTTFARVPALRTPGGATAEAVEVVITAP